MSFGFFFRTHTHLYTHRYTFGGDGSLRISSAQVTDTGRYLCMATNQAGTQRRRVDLQVYGASSYTMCTSYIHPHRLDAQTVYTCMSL